MTVGMSVSYCQDQGQCLSTELRDQNIASSTEIAQSWAAIKSEINGHHALSLRQSVTIPVVVHVLWRDTSDNISADQIMSQIVVINEDFNLQNLNFNSTPLAFQALAADIELEFCLAKRDPNNLPTEGITRKQVFQDNIGSSDAYYQSVLGGQDAWDVNRYLNIWVCEIAGEVFGFATYPGMAVPLHSDGIVIEAQYFGKTGKALKSKPHHLGRTLTHELGHYFGLDHLWGSKEGDCDEDDGIADTPPQEFSSDGCPQFPLRDICSPRSPGVMFCNYMDYTSDSCMTMFSLGQKEKMHNALTTMRSGLIESEGCRTVGTDDLALSVLDIWPNPVALYLSWDIECEGQLSYRIYNGLGDCHLSGSIVKGDKIDVSKLSHGTYFIVLKGCQRSYLNRFIKN